MASEFCVPASARAADADADADAGQTGAESASIKSSAATAALDKLTDLEDIAARLRY